MEEAHDEGFDSDESFSDEMNEVDRDHASLSSRRESASESAYSQTPSTAIRRLSSAVLGFTISPSNRSPKSMSSDTTSPNTQKHRQAQGPEDESPNPSELQDSLRGDAMLSSADGSFEDSSRLEQQRMSSSFPDVTLERMPARSKTNSVSNLVLHSLPQRKMSRFSIHPESFHIIKDTEVNGDGSGPASRNTKQDVLEQINYMIEDMSLDSLRALSKNQAIQIDRFQRHIFAKQDEKEMSVDSVGGLVIMAGWMWKKSQILRNWIRRFVTLKGSYLNFHEGPRLPIKSFIKLETAIPELIQKSSSGYIQIRHDGTITTLKAEAPESNRDWMMAIGCQTSLLSYLHKLKMIDVAPDPRVIRYFQKSHASQLLLDNHPIHLEALSALRIPLSNTCFLQTISLCQTDMDDIAVEGFCDAIQDNQSIAMIRLDSNKIRDAGAASLSKKLKDLKSIISVSLKKNHISSDGFVALYFAALSSNSITEMDLSDNCIDSRSAELLRDSVPMGTVNSVFYKLSVANNPLGNVGVSHLVAVMQFNSCILTDIDLSGTKLDDDGVEFLASFLPKSKLVSLNLSSNLISRKGGRLLLQAFEESPSLLNMDLSNNEIYSDDLYWMSVRDESSQIISAKEIYHTNIDDRSFVMRMNKLRFTKEYIYNPSKVVLDMISRKAV